MIEIISTTVRLTKAGTTRKRKEGGGRNFDRPGESLQRDEKKACIKVNVSRELVLSIIKYNNTKPKVGQHRLKRQKG